MRYNMQDKIALVTGGTSGIGRSTADAFACEGAHVIIASRGKEAGERTVQEITAAGGQAAWVQTDVSDPQQVAALFDVIQKQFGRLDYAFNNGGSGGRSNWLHDFNDADWDQTINGFLSSVYRCMKGEIRLMLEHGGVIVNNSSVDGQRAFPMDVAYSTAKHGVLGLTKSAAVQYAQRGVRINAICPGWIATPATEGLMHDENALRGALMHQPIGRTGWPQEVAEAVLWLCSDNASMILGAALAVDGGYLAV